MATATKKAGNAAKTNTKSSRKKPLTKKPESAKAVTDKTPTALVEKPKRTEADGFENAKTVIKTAETVAREAENNVAKSIKAKKSAGANGGKKAAKKPAKDYSGLSAETLVRMYRTMYQSRRGDDKEILLKGQNKIFFQISGAGHEAVLVAAAQAMKPAYDWFFPYYRDRALMLGLGMTPQEMLFSAVGAEADPNSHGRQMPSHWGHKDLNVPSQSSCTGTQALHAVGAAEASYRASLVEELQDKITGFKGDEVVYMSIGDGTSSEGEVWEALNTACNLKLPVIFVVEDNGYAISTPVEVGTAGGDISKLVSGFPNLLIQKCDGTNPIESYETFKKAVEFCRERKGAAFVHAKVVRPYSHSLSDDEKLYRPAEELEKDAAIDPIKTFAEFLMTEGIASSEDLEKLRKEVDKEINEAADIALITPQPAPETALRNIFSPDVDPTSKDFDTEDGAELSGNAGTMVDLINRCMHEEMERDVRIVVFGEDVADCSREEYLETVKGKGGVFKVTANLQRKFGSARVFNSPLAEANIVGRAVGMAIRGIKPVVEIQFFDYIFPAFHQIRNEVAVTRWRSDGDTKCPMVMRVPVGGYLKGGAVYHSQSGTTLFAHTPGLMIVYPSNALDANGLLRTSIRCDDPVLFLEHKHLYRQIYNKSQYPSSEFLIPFGKAKIVREGTDITIVTYGALVQRSFEAAKRLEKQGISVELIDLRTLVPYDWERIAESVKKTSRVVVAHEDSISYGYGAEIAARISDQLFEYLDAPVRRVGATDTFVAYAPQVEDFILPQIDDVEKAAVELMKY
ncbi:MAG: dehydrogenase E1 component subunit alpha/beta [Pyrinomonadaceae bacterium]|nr:dehydrogenase E1 component subunit alpha/beta [Pyrinomonadaceae bacterium]